MRKEITVPGAPPPGKYDDDPPDVHFKMDSADPDLVTIEQGGSMVFIKFDALKTAWGAL